MSNADRIYEILKEYTGVAPDSGAARPILQAMEQYGKDRYEEGVRYCREVCYDVLDPEITRLRKLVKAQKELIEELVTYTPYIMRAELRNRIKELES